MPIHPDNKGRYPANWPALRQAVLERAGGRCECQGECGSHPQERCAAPHWQWVLRDPLCRAVWYPVTAWDLPGWVLQAAPVRIILTLAHLDHQPEGDDVTRILAMCQRCHLNYDRAANNATRRLRRFKEQLLFWPST
jgi:hypothetical protein